MSKIKLVEYFLSSNSNSESDSENSELHNANKKCKISDRNSTIENPKKAVLPLPNSVKSMFTDKEKKHMDNPQLHRGRIRCFPHVRGNWASHIFISYTLDIDDFLDDLKDILITVAIFEKQEELHVSLSKSVTVLHHWIDPLVNDMRRRFKDLNSFHIDLNDLVFICNEEELRTFLCLNVISEQNILYKQVEIINDIFKEYNLPLFYEEPKFHISLLWCVHNVKSSITQEIMSKLNNSLNEHKHMNKEIFSIKINELKFKTGNKTFSFPLKQTNL